ncbi:MAG TPA: ABC transporter permease, partial [Blastocatellia bacterium]|nr:ABC transporter permease [Blastocatellia bacterium]
MESFSQDIRYSLRLLIKNPTYSVIAVITLALGIGANTAIFSVVYGVLLKPLLYKNPEQLVRIYSSFVGLHGPDQQRAWLSPPELVDLQRDSHSWQSLDGWANGGANLTGGTQPIRVTVSNVTGGIFQNLGVS